MCLAVRVLGHDAGWLTLIEAGVEDTEDASWVVNGDSIILQSPEGMSLAFNRKGADLVADMGGMTLTFTKK